ncbi:phage protein [Corynebacterium renale]|uniref:sigma-70 family RNA polymerase sigma factor n=1 Tax=Corynebacterium renale TaxID=1724 RepID=UPI000DA2F23E|nr:sigma-70 family RNA polymerase sigma factor [Corynebacterium renale]SQG63699.1 phage protein [Corynebacterium renale]STD01655.1 phage protein [Corynebacterium renale]
MTTQPNRSTSDPYSVRTKKVSGKVYTQIYVPSTISKDRAQNYAWIELVDPPVGDDLLGLSADEVLGLLYDPTYVPGWKVAYLRAAYRSFRAVENARNRGDLSYSDWEVEVHDGPQYLNVSVHEEQIDSELVVDWLLSQVSDKQAEHIRLHVFNGSLPLSYYLRNQMKGP